MNAVMLDASQLNAVEVEPSDRQVVIAGPGSGKTEVVAHLVENLVAEHGLEGASEILVISFSNAALHAVDARLRTSGMDPVNVQTLDSLAAEILRDLSDVDPVTLHFDRRVSRALEILEGSPPWEKLQDLSHLVVDEVQDIVGVRADLLLAMLECLPERTGFTLLGDPAQAIYDWQWKATSPEGVSARTSNDVIDKAQTEQGARLKELTGQYRARSRDSQAMVALRPAVLDGDRHHEIEELFAQLTPCGSLEDVGPLASRWEGATVMLTRTNGQALLAADALSDLGLDVELRRSAQQRLLARWIGDALGSSPVETLSRADFDSLMGASAPAIDQDAAWRSLRWIAGTRGRDLRLLDLARALNRKGTLPPDVLEQPTSRITVSTIHRAKGLEFDNVVYLEFPSDRSREEPDEDGGERVRVLYVALTRARSLVLRAIGPEDRRVIPVKNSPSPVRWCRAASKKGISGFEFRVDDIDKTVPPGDDPAQTQDHVRLRVRPGDPVTFDLDIDRSSSELPIWKILHEDVPVASTSIDFGTALTRRIGTLKSGKRWPALSHARVEAVSTVAGGPQPSQAGSRGLWLAPACRGMLSLDWGGARE